jgi:hypothetical protein
MDISRRRLLALLAACAVSEWKPRRACALAGAAARTHGPKVIVLACGGIRRAETFSETGVANIPNLYGQLLPRSTFFSHVRNAGVTSHYNTTSSIITGNWQRVDDWGKVPPESPTIFEYARRNLGLAEDEVWLISSNKALTSQIGASSDRNYGRPWGANVIFPKQLLIDAVVNAASHGHASSSAERATMQPELAAMLEANNYEGLGWSVAGSGTTPGDNISATVLDAIQELVRTHDPVTGDEFTFLVATEVMRRFSPPLLVMSFSDVEVAHFGSYSLHLAGIRTLDRLVRELWDEIETNPQYRGRTTLFVLPEFGRDLDGSPTNGFFNHRLDNDSTRLTWMMCLGPAARAGQHIERPVQHVDVCPTIMRLLGLTPAGMQGTPLPEIRI